MTALTHTQNTQLTTTDTLAIMGKVASDIASRYAFHDEMGTKSENTIKQYATGLNVWKRCLLEFCKLATKDNDKAFCTDIQDKDFLYSAQAWHGVNSGLVIVFKKWLSKQGYAVNSINRHLTTVKLFCQWANNAGIIDDMESMKIANVKTVPTTKKQAQNFDANRTITRIGEKKAQPTKLSDVQANMLKMSHDINTDTGKRNLFIMCLLLDHALRVGDLAQLTKDNFTLDENENIILEFVTQKTGETVRHELTFDTSVAYGMYKPYMPSSGASIWASANRNGQLLDKAISPKTARVTLSRLVKQIGAKHDIDSLSPHDCRHWSISFWARRGYSVAELRDIGGWSQNSVMPMRYTRKLDVVRLGK